MSTVEEIESAIRRLSEAEFAALRAWMAEFDSDAWDRQLVDDAQNGRLQAFYESLQRENDGHPLEPLDEVCNHEELPQPAPGATR